ncbi:MAG: pentapeptide repeat-containing protein, partial [Pseudomonas sp.]|nr:pentapeptide repeat-containing protein [Pseudomonas sp.]
MQYTDVADSALQRDELQDLIDRHSGPLRLIGVDLSGVDLSRMALDNWVFERCTLVQTSFLGSRLEGTQWKNCRASLAIFEAANLLEAQFHSC